MHGLIAPFLDVIALAIILLLIRLAVFRILIIAKRMIVMSIVSMMIVRLLVIAIALVALIIVSIFVVEMLLVAWFTAAHDGKMSRFLLFWLHYVLVDLLKNTSRFVGCSTLIRKSNELDLFLSPNLNWCALGCAKKICLLFSCAVGISMVWQR